MKFSELKSIGHNVADSLASGICFMIGMFAIDIFESATASPDGYIDVDFLDGKASGGVISQKLAKAVTLYKAALPDLCARHGVSADAFAVLTARFAVDRAYGPHFTVTVADHRGHISTDHYLGRPGRRIKRRRAA